MIVEGIITTLNLQGELNIAPMGPLTDPGLSRLTFRPFKSSQTYKNLKQHPQGVFHTVDDAELIARSCVGKIEVPTQEAELVKGRVLKSACSYFEFRVVDLDDRDERTTIEVEILKRGELKPFFGFNRAKHAVIEAAILASRIGIISDKEIVTGMNHLQTWVDKTGGESEIRAFEFLKDFISSKIEVPTAAKTTIQTGSRLHFGLINPSPSSPRIHGGLGLMVEDPKIKIVASPSDQFEVRGPGSQRVEEALRGYLSKLKINLPESHRFTIEAGPKEHLGLGSGTQLCLAVSRLVEKVWGHPTQALPDLCKGVQRGRRSAIGAWGFERGGLLIDGGHARTSDRSEEDSEFNLAPLLARYDMPADWAVLLVIPNESKGLSGPKELAAFKDLEKSLDSQSNQEISHNLLLSLLPAFVERDFDSFTQALGQFQIQVGELFSKVQGGVFSHELTHQLVKYFKSEGIHGTGQSSWGPTIFAILQNEERAAFCKRQLIKKFSLSPEEIWITRAKNEGAQISYS